MDNLLLPMRVLTAALGCLHGALTQARVLRVFLARIGDAVAVTRLAQGPCRKLVEDRGQRRAVGPALLFLLIASAPTFAAGPPRLWEVTGKGTHDVEGKFYILPITHNGLAVEHDDYFYKTVVPIALRADVFLSEASVMFAHEAPPCKTPLPNTKVNRNILRQAYAAVEKAEYDFAGPAPEPAGISEQDRIELREAMHIMAHQTAERLSEYGLILQMQTYLYSTQVQYPARLPKRDADYVPLPTIADYLIFEREKMGLSNASVDGNNDLYEAYCNMGMRRAAYLRQQLEWLAPTKFAWHSKAEIATFGAGFLEAMKTMRWSPLFSTLPTLTDDYDQQMVCERNDKWLVRMKEQLGTGVRFYALGLAHVVQPAPSHKRCDGLLERLRRDGFAVRLVE